MFFSEEKNQKTFMSFAWPGIFGQGLDIRSGTQNKTLL